MKLKELLEEGKRVYDWKFIKNNKLPLSDEERKEVFKRDAVWHTTGARTIDPNTGRRVEKVSAIWKAKTKKGDIVYGCNTHRATAIKPTFKAALNAFKFIKTTA